MKTTAKDITVAIENTGKDLITQLKVKGKPVEIEKFGPAAAEQIKTALANLTVRLDDETEIKISNLDEITMDPLIQVEAPIVNYTPPAINFPA